MGNHPGRDPAARCRSWPTVEPAVGLGCCAQVLEGASSLLLPEPQTCPVPVGKSNTLPIA